MTAARRIYDGLKDPKSGAQLYPGLARGSEPFWVHRDLAQPVSNPDRPLQVAGLRRSGVGLDDVRLRRSTRLRGLPRRPKQKFAPLMNATDPNLEAFRKRGGKLVQYHGWNDQLITPLNSIDYYESVLAHFGRGRDRPRRSRTCRASFGCSWRRAWRTAAAGPARTCSTLRPRWNSGSSPASRPTAGRRGASVNGVVDRSRPLCVYPAVAVYRGSGDTNDAASFECAVR